MLYEHGEGASFLAHLFVFTAFSISDSALILGLMILVLITSYRLVNRGKGTYKFNRVVEAWLLTGNLHDLVQKGHFLVLLQRNYTFGRLFILLVETSSVVLADSRRGRGTDSLIVHKGAPITSVDPHIGGRDTTIVQSILVGRWQFGLPFHVSVYEGLNVGFGDGDRLVGKVEPQFRVRELVAWDALVVLWVSQTRQVKPAESSISDRQAAKQLLRHLGIHSIQSFLNLLRMSQLRHLLNRRVDALIQSGLSCFNLRRLKHLRESSRFVPYWSGSW